MAEDGGGSPAKEEAEDKGHDFSGAFLPEFLGRRRCLGVPRFEDGVDVLGAEGGERPQRAWIHKLHQLKELVEVVLDGRALPCVERWVGG